MNALERIPDNLETPQYDFLGRSVAPAKNLIKAPSFLAKGVEGNLFVEKPLRTHVCVVDRQALFTQKHHLVVIPHSESVGLMLQVVLSAIFCLCRFLNRLGNMARCSDIHLKANTT